MAEGLALRMRTILVNDSYLFAVLTRAFEEPLSPAKPFWLAQSCRAGAQHAAPLHAFVVGAAATFGDDPINNLVGIGNITRLAMHAIRGVDLQLQAAIRLLGHLVHRSRTKILAGIPVFLDALCCTNIRVRHAKMARLIFLMPRPGVIHVRQPVKRQLAIALESFRSRPPVER